MIVAITFSSILVLLTILAHFEILQAASLVLPTVSYRRLRIVIVVFLSFVAHMGEVSLYAGGYYLFVETLGLGGLGGFEHGGALGYFYLSAQT